MKTYYKMYGLNFTEVTPKEYADLNTVNDNTLYIVAPDQYNNYIEPAYSVELYLGSVRLGAIKSITNDTNIADLDYGFYEIKPAAADKNKIKITINLESHIEFKNVSSLDKSYIFINQYTRGSTSGISITTSGDVTIKESNSTSNNYSGMVAVNLSNNNGNISIIKDSIKSLENSEQQINKVDSFELNNTSSKTYPSTKAVAGLVSKSIADVERTTNKVSNFELNDTNETTYPNTKAVAGLISDTVKDYEKTSNKVNSFTKDNASTSNYPSTKAVADFVVATVGNIDSGLSTTVTQIVNHGGYIGKQYKFVNYADFWRDEYADLLGISVELTEDEIIEIENKINNDASIDNKTAAIETAKIELLKSKRKDAADSKFKSKVLNSLTGEIFNRYDDRNLSTPYGEANAAVGWLSHARGAHTTAIGHYAETSGYKTIAGSQGSHAEGCCGTSIMELPNSLTYSKDLSGRNKPKVQLNQYFNDRAQSMIDKSVGFSDGTFEYSSYWAGFIHNHLDIDPNHLATVGYVGTVSLNNEGVKKGTYDFGGAIAFASHTEGSSCFAIGGSSHAEGYATKTYSNAAHAEGAFSKAHGSYSHAEGLATYSYASGTHAEGINTHAQNIGSHAEGAGTKTYGDYSHAEGYKTLVNGKALGTTLNDDNFSIVKGLKPAYDNDEYSSSNRDINDFEYAKNCDAWALGWSDIFYSRLLATYNECVNLDVSLPVNITNSEYFTYLNAFKTEVGNTDTLVKFRESLNLYTFSDGNENLAADEVKLRLDNYSNLENSAWPTKDCIEFLSFIAKTFRMNAIGKYAQSYRPLPITNDEGKTYTYMYAADFSESESVPQLHIDRATFENSNISSNYPYVERYTTKDGSFKYRYAHPFRVAIDWAGYPLVDSNIHMYLGQGSHVEGYECQTSGNAAHAEGYRTWATAYSHAEGYECSTNGAQTSHVEGAYNQVNTYCSHAEGKQNRVSGSHSHAEGESNAVEGINSHAEGASNLISKLATNAHVGGRDNHVKGENNFVHANYSGTDGYDVAMFGKFGQGHGSDSKLGFTYTYSKDSNGIPISRSADLFVVGNGDAARDENSNPIHVFYNSWIDNRNYIILHSDYTDIENITADYKLDSLGGYEKVESGGEYIKYIKLNETDGWMHKDNIEAYEMSDDSSDKRIYAKLVDGISGNYYKGIKPIYSQAFRVTADGTCYAEKSFEDNGADYAEYYEWSDGNPNNEDRCGLFVTYDNEDKIRIANNNDDYILGIVSANPVIVGNSQYDAWQGKYLTDIFGRRLTKTIDIPEREIVDEYTKERTIIPACKETIFVINPEYDASKAYIPRQHRQEWSPIGTHGQLIVIDDGTCGVNKYCKVSANGTATASDTITDYRVIKRLDNNHIKIVIK